MKRATREEKKKINKFLDSKDKEEADEKFAWESEQACENNQEFQDTLNPIGKLLRERE